MRHKVMLVKLLLTSVEDPYKSRSITQNYIFISLFGLKIIY